MKAVRIHAFGGPDVLAFEDAPVPKLKAGEMLIQVHAAGVNPLDWGVREGYLQGVYDFEFPIIVGWDIAGIVAEVNGSGGKFQVGDAVYGMPNVKRAGGYAEYAAVQRSDFAPKPTTLDFVQAAAVPAGALTAWQGLFEHGELTAGQTVLIHAAAGGVGSFAVQFAKAKGATVIGTASAKNKEFLFSLGVDQFVDYTSGRFEDAVHEADVVFDLIGGETQERSWQTLKKGGILVSAVPPSPALQERAEAHGVRGILMSAYPSAAQLEEITALIDAGKVKPSVEAVLPLSEAGQAHEMSRRGHTRGKIVLTVAE